MLRRATYRIQLHQGFGFDDAAGIVPYLADLGVSHLYCSPFLQAAAGSTHGYDVVDHEKLNDELGGRAGYARLGAALDEHGLGQVLDIVPNHMASSGGRASRWWWDVLENGPSSTYAAYFDIDWEGSEDKHDHTVLAPVLGDHYGRVLEDGDLVLERDDGSVVLRYFDHELPVSPRTLDGIVGAAADITGSTELAEIAKGLGDLPHAERTDRRAVADRHRDKELWRERLADLCRDEADVADAVDAELAAVSADPDRLDALLARQNYRLASWRTASEELDYRRFFSIETLVGLRVERDEVFADTHRLVLGLVAAGTIDGLRVDHVDGLQDPQGYLDRLRHDSGGAYTVVEKILEPGEELPRPWPVEGTSGYDFVTRMGNLLVDAEGEAAMTGAYAAFTGELAAFEDVVHTSKLQVMRDELAAEVDRLTRLLRSLTDQRRRHRDHTRRELREVMCEVLAAFDIYRTYVHPSRPVAAADRGRIDAALAAAAERRPDLDGELLDLLGRVLTLEESGEKVPELALRFQQVSSAVMAKGVEDTAFYRYHRLISLNEVGGDPGVFGRSLDDFHTETAKVARDWPDALLTLSTHDTKRSADVRARIHVLSEIPALWADRVTAWAERNEVHKRDGLPERNTEYLLYQTLVGAWPLSRDRLVAFMEKASREAKLHTSWIDPDPVYDEALVAFIDAILGDHGFIADLESFLDEARITSRGRANALTQTALLLTTPGVADLYQGTELWDLSLVDPDNRRPVDYQQRRRVLAEVAGLDAVDAGRHGEAGGTKLWMIRRLLADRRLRPAAYTGDTYEPLEVTGPADRHVVAFRRDGLAVVTPRLVGGLDGGWRSTVVDLPSGRWRDVLSDRHVDGGRQDLRDLLAVFPVAVFAPAGASAGSGS